MSAPLSAVQVALRDAQLGIIGPQFGIGGDAWSVERPSGGITAAATLTPVGSLTGYVRRAERAKLQISLPGVQVPDNPWVFTAPLDQALDDDEPLGAGCVLTSEADSALVFTVSGVPPVAGYLFALVKEGR